MNADERGRPVCRGLIRVHPWFVKAVFPEKNPGKLLAGHLKDFLGLAEKLKDFEGCEYFERERPLTVRLWLFAHNGVTPKAETLLCEHGMYWSDRSDIDALIKLVGLRKLPR